MISVATTVDIESSPEQVWALVSDHPVLHRDVEIEVVETEPPHHGSFVFVSGLGGCCTAAPPMR